MEKNITISVCFKEQPFSTSNFSTNKKSSYQNHLNFKPLFTPPIDTNKNDSDLLISTYNTMSEEEKKLHRIFTVEVKENQLDDVLSQLKNDNDIDFFEVNELFETKLIPNDPAFPELYGLKKIECEKAWSKSKGEDIIVAVIDTGVDYNHPDIKGNMWNKNGVYGYNFSENNTDPMDYKGHGTHVAGTIGAILNNEIGIVGVAPNVKIMGVKIFPKATQKTISQALKFAVDNGAKILNNSWGPRNRHPSYPTIEAAIDYVYSKGGICIFAAGNENDDTQYYSPANYSKTIAVGATNSKDLKPSFSNYGNKIAVYAPGDNILSLENDTKSYNYKSGTSMAAPHVSGALALYLSLNPYKSFNNIVNDLKNKSDLVNNLTRLNCNKLIK